MHSASSLATAARTTGDLDELQDLATLIPAPRRAPAPEGEPESVIPTEAVPEGATERYSHIARLADALVISGAATLAWGVIGGDVQMLPETLLGGLGWVLGVLALWTTALHVSGVYEAGRIGDTVHDLRGVARSSAFLGAAVAILAYVVNWDLSRMLFGVTFGLGLLLLLLVHLSVRRALQGAHARGLLMQRVVAVGSRHAITDLVKELNRSKSAGLKVVAACVPDTEAWEPIENVGWVLPTSTLHEVVKDTNAEHVFLLQGAGESSRHVRRIAWSIEGTGARLAVVPQMTDIAHGRIRPRPVAGLPLIELEQPELTGPEAVLKRVLDVVGALVALVLLSPVWATVAWLIKREDGGPIFYRQIRVGTDEQEFCCYKFRSMAVDADRRLAELQELNQGTGVLFKIKEDPRVTRIGKFIRRHSIDELPQLLNVLKGDMSLVGPRPSLPHEVEKYHSDMTRRLKVRPGMTGLWQVSGRSELDAEESERLDLYYVDNWSVWHDLLILWKTVKVVATGHGAY